MTRKTFYTIFLPSLYFWTTHPKRESERELKHSLRHSTWRQPKHIVAGEKVSGIFIFLPFFSCSNPSCSNPSSSSSPPSCIVPSSNKARPDRAMPKPDLPTVATHIDLSIPPHPSLKFPKTHSSNPPLPIPVPNPREIYIYIYIHSYLYIYLNK